ncbi:hypothetical protein NX059_001752 [Plenodomus lindquistii]|nr:hypothetical protein NX059_001752 [Plenodomus lindquistii]
MPGLSAMPILRYISTLFATIFLGFGTTYISYPRTGYSLFGFSSEPTSHADWEVMERVMVLFGAKDLFLGAAIFISTWFGTRRSAGLILVAASACAGVDGYVVGNEAGENHWNHWGYGSVMGIVGLVMAGLLGRQNIDVGLSTLNVASTPAISVSRRLRFLSTVDTARIPLYLAAGPSLDVWTSSEATETWFESILLSKPASAADDSDPGGGGGDWWDLARSQAPVGILVQVDHEGQDVPRSRVTEILFYGTIAAAGPGGLPASRTLTESLVDQLPELQVHALPLSSDLLRDQDVEMSDNAEAQFLPPTHGQPSAPVSPKRKRDLFEEATIANRKVRGKGGQGVAAMAARGNESQQMFNPRRSLSMDMKATSISDTRSVSAHGPPSRPTSRHLSRSSSLSSDRPTSRKDPLDAHSKRSTLSQVATIPIQPEEPTTESRNKEALSKVVMAAMRMHGLQQKKSRSRRSSLAPGLQDSEQMTKEALAEEVAKDDEYKLIYHQAYKGAALALRKHMAEKPLHAQPDRLRDVVEKLLTIFLTDPLSEPLPSATPIDHVATPGSKNRLGVPGSTHGHASPFDLPSIGRRPGMMRSVTEGHVSTGSPVSKRKTNTSELAAT